MSHFSPLLSALVTLLLTTFLLHSNISLSIQDVPNERSLHASPVPRTGGVGLMAGVLSGWGLIFNSLMWWIILPMLLLFVVSLVDDVRGLSVRKRFTAHITAALILVIGSGFVQDNALTSLILILMVVWMINLYNFMDGSDGLAGGMALFGFSTYGVAALMGNDFTFAMMCFSVGAAAIGFLCFNFAPAKIFMGDAGSIPLGFLSASIGFVGWINGVWPFWFPFMVFSPFVMDATVTLIRRAVRGERVWQAHREHYYQRLVQLGVGHRATALIEYALMFIVGTSALWVLHDPSSLLNVFFVLCLLYGFAMAYIDYRWRVTQRA